MHDLDRTSLEAEQEQGEAFLFEGEDEGELEAEHELEAEGEYEHELEAEGEYEHEAEGESPFHEAEAMELAAELLTVTREAELNHFLGDVLKKGFGAVKAFATSPIGSALGSALKPIAKAALPIAGGALGGMIAGPAGASLGSKLASGAGSLFGLELEGLSHEDREFETAKQFVHLAGAAAKSAARAAAKAPHVAPRAIAHKAIATAARTYAPGLLRRPGLVGVAGPRPVLHGAPRVVERPHAVRPGARQRVVLGASGAHHPQGYRARRSVNGVAVHGGPTYVRPGVYANGAPDVAYVNGAPDVAYVNGARAAAAPIEPSGVAYTGGARQRGTWYRRGDRIILVGA